MISPRIYKTLLLLVAIACVVLNSANQNTSVTISCDASKCFVITGNKFTQKKCLDYDCLLDNTYTATFVACTNTINQHCSSGICLKLGYQGCSKDLPFYVT